MTSSASALRLLSLNVNGLRLPATRRTLFRELLQGLWDVIVLQETHHNDEAEGLTWAREGAGTGQPWLGQSFWSCSTNNPTAVGGVAVLFRAGAAVGEITRVAEVAGKFLLVTVRHAGDVYAIASVYAPTYRPERCQFFCGTIVAPCLSHRAPAAPWGRLQLCC